MCFTFVDLSRTTRTEIHELIGLILLCVGARCYTLVAFMCGAGSFCLHPEQLSQLGTVCPFRQMQLMCDMLAAMAAHLHVSGNFRSGCARVPGVSGPLVT